MSTEDFKSHVEQGAETPESQHEAPSQISPNQELSEFIANAGDDLSAYAQCSIALSDDTELQMLLINTMKDKLTCSSQHRLSKSEDPSVQTLLIETLRDKLAENAQEMILETGNLDVINAYLEIFSEPKSALTDVLMSRAEPEIKALGVKLWDQSNVDMMERKGLSGEYDIAVADRQAKRFVQDMLPGNDTSPADKNTNEPT